jgi:3',5'-cyclic AMP phosphodiesterase CpdA
LSIRLAITSDLHVDHHLDAVPLLAAAIADISPDVLVVAGDLTANDSLLEKTLTMLRPFAQQAVFVPGNHDLWCRPDDPDSRRRYEELVPERVKAAGFVALGQAGVAPPRFFGHRFVGVTGWFDYSLRNRDLDETFTPDRYREGRFGALQWSDKIYVRWPGEHGLLADEQICDEQVRSLETQLAQVGDEPTVAVTHHLPFAEMVTSKGILPWDFLNGFMGSARLGDAMRRTPGVKLAISGHTHFHKDVTIACGGDRTIRALTSPLGYPREYKREGFTLAERVRARVTCVEL